MKNNYFTILCFLFAIIANAQFNYQRTWGTYFGGNDFSNQFIATDSSGNVYITGLAFDPEGAESTQYYSQFTTQNAHQETFNDYSAILAKFSPQGVLLWSTYILTDFGMVNDDIYAIGFDSEDNIYITGELTDNVGFGTITETPDFDVASVEVKGFLAKFSSEGNQIWGKYLPTIMAFMAIDSSNKIYMAGYSRTATGIATPGVFQETFDDSNIFAIAAVIACYDSDGNKLWATFNANNNSFARGISLDGFGNVYTVGSTFNYDNFYATPSCFQSQSDFIDPQFYKHAGYVSKFSNSGQRLWSTYFGLSNDDDDNGAFISGCKFKDGYLYIAGTTAVKTNIATVGSYQVAPITPFVSSEPLYSNTRDGFVAKFDSNGQRIFGSYFGGEKADYCAQMEVSGDAIIVSGFTKSLTNIGTADSFQPNRLQNTYDTGFFMALSLDGTTKKWGSYYGAEKITKNLNFALGENDILYLAGSTQSYNGISTPNALQPNKNTGSSATPDDVYNMFIARFDPIPLSTDDFSKVNLKLLPNPNDGNFKLQGSLSGIYDDLQLLLYDNLGRLISTSQVFQNNQNIDQQFNNGKLTSGIYFAKLSSGSETLKTFKVVVR